MKLTKKSGMGSHQSSNMGKDEWLTPPELIESLGEFDLDPCSPINRPWPTAKKHFTIDDNGLLQEWAGRVWCNPPYGKEAGTWLNRMALHQNGIALVFARLETNMFFDYVWDHIHSYFVIKGRLHFYHVDGTRAKANSGAPSVLLSYSQYDSEMIEMSGLRGRHLPVAPEVVMIGFKEDKRTWRVIVGQTIKDLDGEASLDEIYDKVVSVAPQRVARNRNFKAKVRQMLYFHFDKQEEKWVA